MHSSATGPTTAAEPAPAAARAAPHPLPGPLVLGLFVLSGFAGLVYQALWSHYLGLVLGHAAYAQSLVLAIFMGGMAAGAWLAARRGLAYAEFNSLNMMQPLNVAESTLALRAAADYASRLGRDDLARARMQAFEAAWPDHARIPAVARRFPG